MFTSSSSFSFSIRHRGHTPPPSNSEFEEWRDAVVFLENAATITNAMTFRRFCTGPLPARFLLCSLLGKRGGSCECHDIEEIFEVGWFFCAEIYSPWLFFLSCQRRASLEGPTRGVE